MKLRRTHPILMLICVFAFAVFPFLAAASEYHGQVTFGGFPVPGATITATQGTKKFTTVTDQGGLYNFADLPDCAWKIEVEMQRFSTIQADVNVSPQTPAAKWELTLLPLDQIMARTKLTQLPPVQLPTLTAPAKKTAAQSSAAPVDIPKPPSEANEQAADGFLVNGSVSNAATSQFALTQAFGNRRYGSKALYNGGFAAVFDNSTLDRIRSAARTHLKPPTIASRASSPSAAPSRFRAFFRAAPTSFLPIRARAIITPRSSPAWCRQSQSAPGISPAFSMLSVSQSPSTIPPLVCHSRATSSLSARRRRRYSLSIPNLTSRVTRAITTRSRCLTASIRMQPSCASTKHSAARTSSTADSTCRARAPAAPIFSDSSTRRNLSASTQTSTGATASASIYFCLPPIDSAGFALRSRPTSRIVKTSQPPPESRATTMTQSTGVRPR